MLSASDEFRNGMPKLRSTSTGIVKRMASMESANGSSQHGNTLQPSKLNLRKASVDDLRRIYEDRASAAETLVAAGRRSSHNSQGSGAM